MKRTRRRRLVLLVAAGAPLVLVAGVLLYLCFGDLGRHRGFVEDRVSEALGRRLTIAGDLEVRLRSLTPRVIAEDVTLANPGWADDPAMVHVDRLEGKIDLRSVLSAPLRISDVTVDGAQVRLETDGKGRASWDFDVAPAARPRPADQPVRPPVVFERALLRNVDFSYRDLSTGGGIAFHLDSARLEPQPSNDYQVAIEGDLDGTPFDVSGSYGPIDPFILFRSAQYDLRGRLARIEFAIAGRMSNLQRLAGSDSTVSIHGPDIDELTRAFGLASSGAGPFELEGSTRAGESHTEVDVRAGLGGFSASARGSLRSLLSTDELDLEIEAEGPDLNALGALLANDRLPAVPFSASGRVQRQDGIATFHGVRARLADDRVSVEGVVGGLPRLVGTDLSVSASGDDLAQWSPVVGVRLPGGAYELRGRVERTAESMVIHDLRLGLGENVVRAEGEVSDPPRFEHSDLSFEAEGPDLSAFSPFVGVELPPGAFRAEGRIRGGEERIELDELQARLGQTRLELNGSTPNLTRLDGLKARFRAEGQDLAEVLALAGLDGLPREPFRVDGSVRVDGQRVALAGVRASVGEAQGTLEGTIAVVDGLVGTEIDLGVSGPDLSTLGHYLGYEPLPGERYRVQGGLGIDGEGYHLRDVRAEVGSLAAKVDGVLGMDAPLEGAALKLELRGARLSDLGAFGKLPDLPALPFEIAGRVTIENGVYSLNGVAGTLDANHLAVEGRLGPFPELEGTVVSLSASGPDLAQVAESIESAAETRLPDLPHEPFELEATVGVSAGLYRVTGLQTRLGDARLSGSGQVGPPPDFVGTDVTVEAHGPRAALIGSIAGLSLPDEPFRVAGRFEWGDDGARFHEVHAEAGSYGLSVDGTLGRWPKLVGTVLDLRVVGPDPALFEQFAELPRLPAQSFEIVAHFDGTPETFSLQRLQAKLGDSDLSGAAEIDLRGKPKIQGRVESRQFDLEQWLPKELAKEMEALDEGERALTQTGQDAAVAERKRQASKPEQSDQTDRRRVFSDAPFDYGILNKQDAGIYLTVDRLKTIRSTLSDLEIGLTLQGGKLRIDPISVVGPGGGKLIGVVELEPVAEAYRLDAGVDLSDVRIDVISHGEDRRYWPTINLRFDLSGEGRSQRELAASLNGYAALEVGSGRLNSSVLDLLASDVLIQLLEILNPFRKEERYTELECAVLVGRVEQGRATLEPLVMQSDKMTMVGHGKVNLENEKFDLSWRSKPRKGIGVSASAITNSYIKIGGTLGDPALEVKPLQAATATGAAVATAGLSLLAQGLWDRVTAEKKVCKKARKLLDEMKGEIEASAPTSPTH